MPGSPAPTRRTPHRVLRWLAPRPFLSLLYHLCGDEPSPHVRSIYHFKTRDEFERDLIYLRERFHTIGHGQVVDYSEGRSALPANAVQLSFDDGLAECFSQIRPLLLKYEIPATFFIVTGLMDNRSLMFRHKISLCRDRLARLSEAAATEGVRAIAAEHSETFASVGEAGQWIQQLQFEDMGRIDSVCELLGLDIPAFLSERRPYLTRDEILQLHRDGFTIGAHSCNHPRLDRLSRVADWEAVRSEIVDSCTEIRKLTGQERVPFAIPFNGRALSRTALEEILDASGFISLVYDTNDLMRDAPRFVNRISVDTPLGIRAGGSNLGFLIQRAHALEPLRSLRRRLR
jgi:peptidoglycan/xylan/chitin deacetylase (PgdA/CDA1 family)